MEPRIKQHVLFSYDSTDKYEIPSISIHYYTSEALINMLIECYEGLEKHKRIFLETIFSGTKILVEYYTFDYETGQIVNSAGEAIRISKKNLQFYNIFMYYSKRIRHKLRQFREKNEFMEKLKKRMNQRRKKMKEEPANDFMGQLKNNELQKISSMVNCLSNNMAIMASKINKMEKNIPLVEQPHQLFHKKELVEHKIKHDDQPFVLSTPTVDTKQIDEAKKRYDELIKKTQEIESQKRKIIEFKDAEEEKRRIFENDIKAYKQIKEDIENKKMTRDKIATFFMEKYEILEKMDQEKKLEFNNDNFKYYQSLNQPKNDDNDDDDDIDVMLNHLDHNGTDHKMDFQVLNK